MGKVMQWISTACSFEERALGYTQDNQRDIKYNGEYEKYKLCSILLGEL